MEQLINRAKQILINPKAEWDIIAKEDDKTAKQHITEYVLPLALIPALATFIGIGLIGYRVLGYQVRSLETGLSQGIISLITTILGVYISGYVIHKLAASYNTNVSLGKAIKLVGFSYTAMLIAGVFNLFPSLAILSLIAGIYSLYILYVGFKPMTNVSEDKTTTYFVVSLLVIIGVYIVIGFILGAIALSMGFAGLR